MRGHILFKEAPPPSLCAFCAYRLGHVRRPSHLQRRFLHSTGPSSSSQGAASVARDDGISRSPQPSWGRLGNLSIPAPTWGASPVGVRPTSPAIASPATSPPVAAPAGWAPSKLAAATTPKDDDDLLPHERAARERLRVQHQEIQAQANKPKFSIPPHISRNGKPLPYTTDERARNRSFIEGDREYNRQRDQGPRIRKVGFDSSWSSNNQDAEDAGKAREDDVSRWGTHLRIRSSQAGSHEGSFPEHDSAMRRATESRMQREDSARTGRFTPLARSDSFRLTPGADNARYSTSRPLSRASGRFMDDMRPFDRDVSQPLNQSSGILKASQFVQDTRVEALSKDRFAAPPALTPVMRRFDDMPLKPIEAAPTHSGDRAEEPTTSYRSFGSGKFSAPRPAFESPRAEQPSSISKRAEVDQDMEVKERGARKKKERVRRGRDADEVEEDKTLGKKDKARDKAKRRLQFVKTEEEEAEQLALAEAKAQKVREKAEKKAAQAAAPTPLFLPHFISVANLAVALKVRYEKLAEKLDEMGYTEDTWAPDYILRSDDSSLISMEYNFDPIFERSEEEDLKSRDPPEDMSILPSRPPVVTIMGHVDHGKTTLLDYLRKSSVAATEHGGITQHIGAFSVPMPSGKVITFLDTPGHAAFLSMRQRGANVTDIVILVVAADDSVKPQTIEAINHAKAASVPMIVAINKIDKPDVDVENVKSDLARHGVEIEDFGGDTQVILVSGKTGQGMEDLEQAAVALSEILDARAETDGAVEGWVLEASIKDVGKVATVLVNRGTIRPGDVVVAGNTWAKVRVLRNEANVEISEAGPGMPVQVDGWREQPVAGDTVLQAPDEQKAKDVVDYRLNKVEMTKLAEDMEAINIHRKIDQIRQKREKEEARIIKEAKRAGTTFVKPDLPTEEEQPTGPKRIYFIVKADVSGSLEAVVDSLSVVGNKEVEMHILRSGVGQVSEFDIEHASAAGGHVINFNTIVEPHIRRLADESKVKIINHRIIYALVDDVKAELSTHLPPLVIHKVLGEAEIAQVFQINIKGRKYKPVAGCKIRNGTVKRNDKIRVLRRGEKIWDGEMDSLKNQKRDITEISKGGECGIGFKDFSDFQVGDQVQTFEEKLEKRYL